MRHMHRILLLAGSHLLQWGSLQPVFVHTTSLDVSVCECDLSF